MSEHLPLDAFEEQHELKEIPVIWAVRYGVAAVIPPLVLYLIFYLGDIIKVINTPLLDEVFMLTLFLSFLCPYIASFLALFHAKRNLGVNQRDKLFIHGLYIQLVSCSIGFVILVITLLPINNGMIFLTVAGLFYIPYTAGGIILSSIQSYFMSRKKTTNTQTKL